MTNESKVFFEIIDDGANHFVVATDRGHASAIMMAAGIEFGDLGDTFDVALSTGTILLQEVTGQRAGEIMCDTSDDGRGRGRIPLNQCDVGEWFSSEY